VASLLICESEIFLSIREVNDILHNSQHLEQIPIDMLSDPSVFVSYQMIHIIPATVEDDPKLKHDWRWTTTRGDTFRVPRLLVEPLNPSVSTRIAQKPFYLFESQALISFANPIAEFRVIPYRERRKIEFPPNARVTMA
jgi:hypothetical protein